MGTDFGDLPRGRSWKPDFQHRSKKVCAVPSGLKQLSSTPAPVCRLLVVRSGIFWYHMALTASSAVESASQFLPMSSEQRASALPLEPSLEALLREVNCHEEIIMAFRVQEIYDRSLFVALESSEDGIRTTAQEAFGINPDKGFSHKRELAKVVKAWSTARLQTKQRRELAPPHVLMASQSPCSNVAGCL